MQPVIRFHITGRLSSRKFRPILQSPSRCLIFYFFFFFLWLMLSIHTHKKRLLTYAAAPLFSKKGKMRRISVIIIISFWRARPFFPALTFWKMKIYVNMCVYYALLFIHIAPLMCVKVIEFVYDSAACFLKDKFENLWKKLIKKMFYFYLFMVYWKIMLLIIKSLI